MLRALTIHELNAILPRWGTIPLTRLGTSVFGRPRGRAGWRRSGALRVAILALSTGVLVTPRADAQGAANVSTRPSDLLIRAYVDYVRIKACERRQETATNFVSSDDFISFAEFQSARTEVSAIEHLLTQLDPQLDRDAMWKRAMGDSDAPNSQDGFGALMMLGLKANRERCRYYLVDLDVVFKTLPRLAETDKDF